MADPIEFPGIACNDWAVGPMRKNALIVLGQKVERSNIDTPIAYMKLSPPEVRRMITALQNALAKLTISELRGSTDDGIKKPT